MDKSGQYEINAIRSELFSIINELENIAAGVNSNFEGIGNDQCAQRIYKTAEHYRRVRQKLGNIDTSKVKEDGAKEKA